jgi:hypothetical protein
MRQRPEYAKDLSGSPVKLHKLMAGVTGSTKVSENPPSGSQIHSRSDSKRLLKSQAISPVENMSKLSLFDWKTA